MFQRNYRDKADHHIPLHNLAVDYPDPELAISHNDHSLQDYLNAHRIQDKFVWGRRSRASLFPWLLSKRYVSQAFASMVGLERCIHVRPG